MKITTKQIKKLNLVLRDLKQTNDTLSDLIKTNKDRYGNNEIELERAGKKIKLTEKVLWDEVYINGVDCQAGRILIKKYPEVFEYQVKSKKLAEDLSNFTMINWGFFFNQMDLGILINLIIAIMKWRVKRFFFLD